MQKFKEIPPNTKKIYCERDGCGPECCDMSGFRIIANYKDGEKLKGLLLWKGILFYNEDFDKETREELEEAFSFYQLPIPEYKNFWEYDDIERIL